jgi:hypothetical protein
MENVARTIVRRLLRWRRILDARGGKWCSLHKDEGALLIGRLGRIRLRAEVLITDG